MNVLDLGAIHEGDSVEIEFDVDPDSLMRYPGRVESISYLATGGADAASAGEGNQKYYSAYISFEADERVRLGMPAIVYLKENRENPDQMTGE